jgi:hypothetical protein
MKKDVQNIIIYGEDYYNEIWSLKEDLEKEILRIGIDKKQYSI